MRSELHELLPSLPNSVGLTLKGDGAWIRCPYHAGGNEKTPSLKINLGGGKYQNLWTCFGCHESGHWNKLAQHFDLPTLDGDFESVGGADLGFRRKLRADKYDEEEFDSTFPWPKDKEWRGIPGNIVHRIGCRVTKTKSALDEPSLIIPVTQHEEQVGHITAQLHAPKRDKSGRKTEKSYINKSGAWASGSLLGFDIANLDYFKREPLWVVEGPRDYMHVLATRLRVVAMMGSSFEEPRLELIRILNPPVILVGTDADDAGDIAAGNILDLCKDYYRCIRINWSKGEDPADQPRSKLKKINNTIKRKYLT